MDCKNVEYSTGAGTSTILIAIARNTVKVPLGHMHSADGERDSFSSMVFMSVVPEAKDKLKCRKGNEFQTKFYFCCNKSSRRILKASLLYLPLRVSFTFTSGHITAGWKSRY